MATDYTSYAAQPAALLMTILLIAREIGAVINDEIYGFECIVFPTKAGCGERGRQGDRIKMVIIRPV
jgi:hypothetical protein